MRYVKIGDSYLVRLETGEEIFKAVADFAADRRIDAGSLSGIGAAYDIVLGYFDRSSRTYLKREVAEEMEIVALTGNIAVKEGRPFPHLHAMLSGREFQAVGGHFFGGKVAATCELVITPLPGFVQRREDAAVGLYLLDV